MILLRPAAVAALALLAAAPASAASFTVLYNFTGGADGADPHDNVVLDANGNAYGLTAQGANVCEPSIFNGCGTLYKIDPAGHETTLVTFNGANGAVGIGSPTLIGNTLYGVTGRGGASDDGVIFKVKTDGSGYSVLHSFSGADGANPAGTLRRGPNGVFYGVAQGGGADFGGTLYELLPDNNVQVLHSFTAGADGYSPNGIVLDANGNIFGGDGARGISCNTPGSCGVVYEFTPSTNTFTILHSFARGEGSQISLTAIGPNGTLYGSGTYGGYYGGGTLFQLVPGSAGYALTVLHAFNPATGGDEPFSGPTIAQNPRLVGTTSNNGGSLYAYSALGYSVLHSFSATDGSLPLSIPLQTPGGAFIGTAATGGLHDSGTVFRYSP